jgi:hypothetical protein
MEKQMMTLKGMNWRGKEDNKAFGGAKKREKKTNKAFKRAIKKREGS